MVELPADSYFIVSGSGDGEGAIVTRDRDSAADVWRLDGDHAVDGWFILETNYDNWQPAGKTDNRRAVAEAAMRTLGPSAFKDVASATAAMWKVISTHTANATLGERPVYNDETIFSQVMAQPVDAPKYLECVVRPKWPYGK